MDHGYERLQSKLLEVASSDLPGQVGKLYAEAVKVCLSMTEKDNDRIARGKLCWKVCAVLDQCIA